MSKAKLLVYQWAFVSCLLAVTAQSAGRPTSSSNVLCRAGSPVQSRFVDANISTFVLADAPTSRRCRQHGHQYVDIKIWRRSSASSRVQQTRLARMA
jgi:hypothetical protein